MATEIQAAPPPGKKESKNRIVHPSEEKFTGFIFKIPWC